MAKKQKGKTAIKAKRLKKRPMGLIGIIRFRDGKPVKISRRLRPKRIKRKIKNTVAIRIAKLKAFNNLRNKLKGVKK